MQNTNNFDKEVQRYWIGSAASPWLDLVSKVNNRTPDYDAEEEE